MRIKCHRLDIYVYVHDKVLRKMMALNIIFSWKVETIFDVYGLIYLIEHLII
jgi:hypothetical protein